MDNIQYINIDIVNHKVYDHIYTKQYDNGRIIWFTITDNNNPVALDSMTILFEMKKPDGYVILDNLLVENGKVKLVLSDQMTAAYGKIPYQLGIYNANKLISTVTGYMIVEEAVVQNSDVESKDEFNVITELAQQLGHVADVLENDGQAIIDAAGYAILNAKISQSYAVGGTDYTHHGVDDDFDNSKYYYELTHSIENRCVICRVVTLYVSEWDTTNRLQTVQVNNVIEDEENQLVVVRPREEYVVEYHNCNVLCIHQGDGYLEFQCDTIPENDLDVFIMVQTSDGYDKNLMSNIIYYPTEPEPNMNKKNDYWVHSY